MAHRDISTRKSLEWGDVQKNEKGNRTLRYKFEATIGDGDVMIANQVFAFDAKGNIVNVVDVVGYPKMSEKEEKMPKKAEKTATPSAPAATTVDKAEGPATAVAEFLEAVRSGNDKAATRMLSTLAKQKTAGLNRHVTPPPSDTAKFTVGKVEYAAKDGARVECTWTDLDPDGRLKTDKAVWVLRHESDGWRIVGVAAMVFPDEPPLLLNFEDPEDMVRKQQSVREEIRRRLTQDAKKVQPRDARVIKELVEDYLTKNVRDVASRETIEWGEVTKTGNSSIRYKYRTIGRGNATKIMNQVFTFDAKGKVVSVKDVEELPR